MTDPGMSEDEKVATLASVAGVEDLDYCRRLLRECSHDLERAVNVAIGVAPSPGPSERGGGHRPDAPRRRAVRPGPGIQRANPILALPVTIVRASLGLVFGVVGLGIRVFGGVLSAVLPPVLARRARALPHAVGGEVDDPVAAAARFRRDLRDACGDAPAPDFRECSHRDALREAQDQLKFLFVYLHSPDHADAPRFCRDVLCDPRVRSLVDERFVAWGGDVRRSDAFRLAAAVSPSTFPYVALLSNVDGRASLLLAVEGTVEPEHLVELLTRAAEEHGSAFDRARASRAERDAARTLREEQDAAFRESLEADARRAEEVERAEAEAARAEAERAAAEAKERAAAERAAAEAAERRRLAESRRAEKAAALREEPAADAPGVCKVAVKFPNGGREERRFLEGDTVGGVYDFVDTLECAGEGPYSLVSSFPRRVFDRVEDERLTLSDAGLSPQAMLMYRLDD